MTAFFKVSQKVLRPTIVFAGLILVWQIVIWATGVPPFILPPPGIVLEALIDQGPILMGHAGVTLAEILLGLLFGTALGAITALAMIYFRYAREWILPILVISQAIPVFALAPILVLWLGFGMPSKVAMAIAIIFFPVTATFYDGLRRTNPGWLDLARTMNAKPIDILLQIQIPAALPAFASGLRVATAVAPIGAVVGEWVGSSAGLGHYLWRMNGNAKAAEMFAALFVLSVIAVGLYFSVDAFMRRVLPWQPDRIRQST
jgi:putative hydroxymethylpyrimidine transport system permease protein